MQSDYATDAKLDSLDKMQEAYEEQKDAEIEILENSISSEQKLYDMAIEYIQNNWDTLYDTLIAWNYEYGTVLNSEITTAWDNALTAAQTYGSYLEALKQLQSEVASTGSSLGSSSSSGSSSGSTSGNNTVVGSTSSIIDEETQIAAAISKMWQNGQAWGSASETEQGALAKSSKELGDGLAKFGIYADRDEAGYWWADPEHTIPFFDEYRHYIYHSGGIAGDMGTLKENELLAKLEQGEAVVSNQGKNSLFKMIEFMDNLQKVGDGSVFWNSPAPQHPAEVLQEATTNLSNITTNQGASVHFGDVVIYGANEDTLGKYQEVTREFTNEVLKHLAIKR